MNCSGSHRPDRKAMGRKIRFTMAGEAAPETIEPTPHADGAERQCAEHVDHEQADALRERQRHVADEHGHRP